MFKAVNSRQFMLMLKAVQVQVQGIGFTFEAANSPKNRAHLLTRQQMLCVSTSASLAMCHWCRSLQSGLLRTMWSHDVLASLKHIECNADRRQAARQHSPHVGGSHRAFSAGLRSLATATHAQAPRVCGPR
jgi:hypothetical protein